MNYAALTVAFLLLLFGRQLYWLFVGGIGFLAGMQLAQEWLTGPSEMVVFAVAILVGAVGAIVAVVLKRFAAAAAGFVAGAQLGLMVVRLFEIAGEQVEIGAMVVGGVLVALFVAWFFDWALITVSAFCGAAFLSQSLDQSPQMQTLILAGLFLVGVFVQAAMLHWNQRRLAMDRTRTVSN